MTTRGFTEIEAERIAHLDRRRARQSRTTPPPKTCAGVAELCRQFPVRAARCLTAATGRHDASAHECPSAAPTTQVTDTRENEDGDTVRRRRRCSSLRQALSPPTNASTSRCPRSSRKRQPHRLQPRQAARQPDATAAQAPGHRRESSTPVDRIEAKLLFRRARRSPPNASASW